MLSPVCFALGVASLLAPSAGQHIESNRIINSYDAKKTKLYWNVPSFQCRSHKVYFMELAEKYGFIMNTNDDFRGDKITILYDPGAFPAILKNKNNNQVVYRNGGVPQEGNLTYHLENYKEVLDEQIPNKDFSGVAVIDMESWRPILRQNFGTLAPYQQLSKDIERKNHPFWTNDMVAKEAARRFEFYAKQFIEETLKVSKQLRPLATWGYYAYPYCFNMYPNNMNTDCTSNVKAENNKISYMFKASDNVHPSLYMPQNRLNPFERIQMIIGRVEEAERIIKSIGGRQSIIPYHWYKYQDTDEFLTKEDLKNSFTTLKALGVDGVIMWGASNDVNSKVKCGALYEYVDKVLGPLWLST